jgi:hypothetical protein
MQRRVVAARRVAGLDGRNVITDGAADEWHAPGVVIAPVADTTPEECRVLHLRGLVPLVLAPLPNDRQRSAYEASGAIYLPMDLESGDLLSALKVAPRASERRA